MTAIAGLFHRTGAVVSGRSLRQMAGALAHRGLRDEAPDLWRDGPVGLVTYGADRRDAYRNQQRPGQADGQEGTDSNTTAPEQALAVAADARIDNRRELEKKLGGGKRLQDRPDGEYVRLAYQKWSSAWVERVRGAFAVALWDEDTRRLSCARDPVGVRPLYYLLDDALFAFATEIKAIRALDSVDCLSLSPVRVAQYLSGYGKDRERTFFQSIRRLPPGSVLEVRPGETNRRQYWAPRPAPSAAEKTDRERVARFRALFREAVRSRLSDVDRPAALLSGGLDSSSIVCMADDLYRETEGGRPIDTFSAVFDEVPECDERPYIRAVTRARDRLRPHVVHADQNGPLHDVKTILSYMDEPFFAPNAFMHWALYRRASEEGVRVLHDGIDGDTTVSHGVGRLVQLLRGGRLWALGLEVAKLADAFGRSPWRLFYRRALRPAAPPLVRRAWRSLRASAGQGPTTISPLLSDDVLAAVRGTQAFEEMTAPRPVARTERAAHRQKLGMGWIPIVLEESNHMAAAHGIEPRHPFFDQRLIEFCLAVPAHQKLRGGWSRRILREAMEGILPEDIRWRGDKSNLSPNFVQGLLDRDQERVEAVVHGEVSSLTQYVDVAALQQLYERVVQEREGSDAVNLFRAVVLAVWLDHHVS